MREKMQGKFLSMSIPMADLITAAGLYFSNSLVRKRVQGYYALQALATSA